jgi:type VI secretion system protein ImpE
MENNSKKPEDWIAEHNLAQAIIAAKQQVLKNPENSGMHFLLFELLVLVQDFSEAEKALLEIQKIESKSSAFAFDFWMGILQAETKRHQFFVGGTEGPGFLLEPPPYTSMFINAISALSKLKIDFGKDPFLEEVKHFPPEMKEIEAEIQKASSQVPQISGTLDGDKFQTISDADDFLKPFLEAFLPGSYIWLPWEQIRSISFASPQSYPDVIWRRAHIELKDEFPQKVFWIPSLYPRAKNVADSFKLGNLTGFHILSTGGLKIAYGQRDIQTEKVLKGIRQVSHIDFQNQAEERI